MKRIFTILLLLCSIGAFSQSTTLVISQVYGAGGNSGALLNSDYVELHNVSAVPVSLSGLSIQYGSSGVSGNWSGVYALPAVSVPAGGYFLIRMTTTGTTGAALPTPDATASPDIAMSGSNGRVALVNGTTPLVACPSSGSYIDFVGYGSSTCYEGSAATAPLSSTLAAIRKNNGCTDTDNNGADFDVTTPAPRNSSSPVVTCGATPPELIATGTLTDFGSITIGSSSASQTYSLSGSFLTGAPGNITVTAPADFEVSNNNTTWAATTTVAYSAATLTATPVYVRFTPQSAGVKTGNVSNMGGGIATAVTVAVSGTGMLPTTPTLSATNLTAFGDVCINSTAGPNSFTINGLNLTATNIAVGPLAGFSFATSAAGTYSPSLSLTQPGGTFTQDVFVKFTPAASQSYNGNISINGGGAPAVTVAATGAGNNNPPTVVSGSASAITTTTATLSGSISSIGCTAITAYGVEYSTVSGFSSGTIVASTNLGGGAFSAGLSALSPSTTYYYKAYATNAGGTAYGIERSFTTSAPVLTATPLTAFGNICVNTTAGPYSFTISSTALNSSNVNVGPRTGFSFATTETGTYSASLSLTQPGGPFTQTVYVKFTPTAIQNYNGSIPVSGGGAAAINVNVTAAGVNGVPVLTTGTSAGITPNAALLNGMINDAGCSAVMSYGIEFSGIRNFINGTGTRIPASNISGNNFSVGLTSLVPATQYYYKAYAINGGGAGYGAIDSFMTTALPEGFILYNVPVSRGGSMHFSVKNLRPDHYSVSIFNSVGQIVYRKDYILQVGFIDESFRLPGNLGAGMYTFEMQSPNGYKERKTFLIQ